MDSDSSASSKDEQPVQHVLDALSADPVQRVLLRAALANGDCDSDDEFDPRDPDGALRDVRFDLSVPAYLYDGDILQSLDSANVAVPARSWGLLPSWERERRWLMEFRMRECTFDALHALVQHAIPESVPVRAAFQSLTTRHKLLITLHFLAHAPTCA